MFQVKSHFSIDSCQTVETCCRAENRQLWSTMRITLAFFAGSSAGTHCVGDARTAQPPGAAAEVTQRAPLRADACFVLAASSLLSRWACAGCPPVLAASSLRGAHQLQDVQGGLGELHPSHHQHHSLRC